MPRERKKKTSFVMHSKFRKSLKDLTDAEYRELIEGLFDYAETRIRPTFSNRIINTAFNSMQEKLDEDYDSWKETCDNRSKAKQEYWDNLRANNVPQENTRVYNCNNSIQELQENTIDTEYEYDYDYDNELYNSVCNNNAPAREEPNICHLGDKYKSISCFECKKRYKCPHPESPDFKLKHPNETFYEWEKRKQEEKTKLIQEMKARGQPVNMDLFDYDWLNES